MKTQRTKEKIEEAARQLMWVLHMIREQQAKAQEQEGVRT